MTNQSNILKLASLLDEKEIIKAAGLFSGLGHLVKKLFSPEYRKRIESLKEQSSDVYARIEEFKNISDSIEDAIDTGNLELYAKNIDALKSLSKELSIVLGVISQEASKVDSESLLEGITPPSPRYVDRVYISDKVKVINEPRIKNALFKADISDEDVAKILSEDIWKLIENNLHKNSDVINFENAKASKSRADRDNERWVTVRTKPFQIFDLPYRMQVTAVVTDMYSRKDINTKWSVKTFTSIIVEGINKTSSQSDFMIKIADELPVQGIGKKTPSFIARLKEVASNLDVKPEWLYAVMMSESGGNPSARNPSGGATGLIQFMPATAEHLGTSTDELKAMSDVQQLDYVERFYKPFAGKMKSPTDVYMATFLPIFVGQPDNTIVGRQGDYRNLPRTDLKYDTVYKQNWQAFDPNKTGQFTIRDIGRRVRSFLKDLPKEEITNEDDFDKVYNDTKEPELSESESMLSGLWDLFNFFKAATTSDAKFIIKSASKIVNSSNEYTIKIPSRDNHSIRFARDLSIILDSALDSDSTIHANEKSVEVSYKCAGSKETSYLVSKQIISEATNAFNKKFNKEIEAKLAIDYQSSLKKISYKEILISDVETEPDEISYSALMRAKDDEQKVEFQKAFKEAFDKAYIDGDSNPEETALASLS